MTPDPLAAWLRPRTTRSEAAKIAALQRKALVERVAARRAPAPLVMGSIVGVRAFRPSPIDSATVTPSRLWPLSTVGTDPWRPGWNDATCPHRCADDTDHKPDLFPVMPFQRPPLPATVAMDCSCGFHAFTDRDELRMQIPESPTLVTAVVEGAGTTVEANDGFRSKRARVRALVLPRREWLVGAWFWTLVCFAAVVANAAVVAAGAGDWLNVAAGVSCTVGAGFTGRLIYRGGRRRWLVKRAARAFGVPTFRSLDAAVAAFPLGLTGPGEAGPS